MGAVIIYLEGVSSAGKTTLAKALQNRLAEPYYWLSADAFYTMPPEKFWENDADIILEKLPAAICHTIKLFNGFGINVIVDFIPVSLSMPFFSRVLHGIPVLYVHVFCPLDELRRRESERGDRMIGLAERQIDGLMPHEVYDIVVDTHNDTIDECVERIVAMLDCPEKWTAFGRLYGQKINPNP